MKPNRKIKRFMNKHKPESKPQKEKKKTLSDMSDKELQDLINQMEYSRIQLPNGSHPNILRVWDQYTIRINFVRDFINTRKSEKVI